MRHKIEVLIIMDDESVKTGVAGTINSIESQSMNFKQNIGITLFASGDSTSKSLISYYEQIYPYNVRSHFSDDINADVYDHLKVVDSDYLLFVKAGDICSLDLFKSAYESLETHKIIVDAAASRIRSGRKLFDDYIEGFPKTNTIIHLLTDYKKVPVTLDGLFVKTSVVKETLLIQEEGTFNELELLCDILSKRDLITTVPAESKLNIPERYIPGIPMDDFMLKSWEFDYLLEKNRRNGYIPYFIQEIIVSHIFRMFEEAEDIMDAYEKPDCDYSEEWEFISRILERIDDNIIIKKKTTRVKKLFIFELKYGRDSDTDLFWDDLRQMYGNTALYNISEYVTRIDIMEITAGKLIIEGYCFVPKGISIANFEIGVFINGEYVVAKQVERYTDRYYYDRVNLWEKGFKIEIPLSDVSYEILFINKIHGHLCYKKNIQFLPLTPINENMKCSYYYKDGYAVTFEENIVICRKCSIKQKAELEEEFQAEITELCGDDGENINELRSYYWENIGKKEKQIWLFMDRPDRADDNAEMFFRYMVKKNDSDIECYFVLSKSAPGYGSLKKLGNVIEPASDDHRRVHMMADYILSSQMAEHAENPFNEDSIYFKDIYHKPRFIWLQHGVIHNAHGKTCGKYYKNFYGWITSAPREHEYLSSEFFHYTQDNMWLTGMPRFDALYEDEKNIITIMPTWRKYLTTRDFDPINNTMIWRVNDDFVESDYYEMFNGLLNDRRLLETARKYGYKIHFMPHVIFSGHSHLFKKNDVVEINPVDKRYREVYAESKLIVTDYTSAVFDFAYLHKPVLYFQFDKERFFAEHTVSKGYFDFEKDGFGEVSYDLQTTVNNIIDYIKADCKLKDKYRARIDTFFKYTDRNCCDRIYEKIKELERLKK